MTDLRQRLGDRISACVNKGTFTTEDMDDVEDIIKEAFPELAQEAGYKKVQENLIRGNWWRVLEE